MEIDQAAAREAARIRRDIYARIGIQLPLDPILEGDTYQRELADQGLLSSKQ